MATSGLYIEANNSQSRDASVVILSFQNFSLISHSSRSFTFTFAFTKAAFIMVRLATLFLSLACSALASPFAKPSDSSLSDVSNVGHVIHERAISKTATKPAIVCELTCKACLAKPAPKKGKDASKGKTTGNGRGKVKGKGKSIPRSLDLRERSLDDIEDLWGTDATAANEYVMEQIDSDTGSVNELDWNLIQHDAVSGQGSWAQQPLRKYIRGLMG